MNRFVLDCSVAMAWCSLQTVGAIISAGREYKLTSYDAAYLELAVRQGLPLATRDKTLKAACKKCGVPVFR